MDTEVDRYLEAFKRLSKSRPIGMSAGRIVLSEIIIYFHELAWFCHDLELFIGIIQALDELFIAFHYKDQPKEAK